MTGEKDDVNPIIVLQETLAGVTKIADDRLAALKAIVAVIVFMKSLPGFTQQIYVPLMHLASALRDLDEGKVSPMLKPANKSKSGRTPDDSVRNTLKGLAAAVTQVLMEHGDMGRLAAAGEVAKILRKNQVPIGKRDSTEASQAAAVAQWRFDAGADPHSQAGEVYHDLSDPPLPNGLQPDEIKRSVLQSFDELLKELRLTGGPPPDF